MVDFLILRFLFLWPQFKINKIGTQTVNFYICNSLTWWCVVGAGWCRSYGFITHGDIR